MIIVDTTFLVDLWRDGHAGGPAARLLEAHRAETFAVPAHAAGEFLEGGATISTDRLSESLAFLRSFRVEDVDLETAKHYAELVAHLRATSSLAGRSKPDMWIAASARRRGSSLATRNTRHFAGIPGLDLIGY